MESRKKNWNGILNNLITSITLILATLLLSICFVVPKSNVNALTQSDIEESGIHFVSAKTKVRTASGQNKVLLNGKNTTDATSTTNSQFYTYQYNYQAYSEADLYYGSTEKLFSTSSEAFATSGALYFSPFNNGSGTQYDRKYGYIPYGVNYFDNVSGEKEEVFYEKIDNNDFVLLDNFSSHLSCTDGLYNVDNFYLSIGSPYIDEKTTTPLADLEVEGKLYSEGREHTLVLNEVEQSTISSGKNAHYWNQYFDLKSLQAYTYNEPGSPTYDIENLQGRYEITFRFLRYDENLQITDDTKDVFIFSFYLLDGEDYSTYPTLNNATIQNTLESNKVTSYYYNFTTDKPYITYDPTRFNLSYERKSNKHLTNNNEISSTYTAQTYTSSSGAVLPLGIITYSNGSSVFKKVFILTNYNSDRTLVEYLYLSVTNPSSDLATPSSYSGFNTYLANGTLDFEYKLTYTLSTSKSGATTTYTTNIYRTNVYENLAFVEEFDATTEGYTPVDSYYITETDDTTHTSYKLNNTTAIATLSKVPATADLISSISTGVMLDNSTLATVDTMGSSTTKYTLKSNNVLEIEYLNNSSTTKQELTLDISTDGEKTAIDPVHNFITIKYTVTTTDGEKSISSVSFTRLDTYKLTSIGPQANEGILDYILNPDKLSLTYSYDFQLEELGQYDIEYAYICPADNNKYYINSTEASSNNNDFSNSTNFSTPRDFAISLEKESESPTTITNTTLDLYYKVSGVLGEAEANKVTLNGIEYTYNPSNTTLSSTQNGFSAILEGNKYSATTYQPFDTSQQVETVFEIENINQKLVLNIFYKIATMTTETTQMTYSAKLNDKTGYIKRIDYVDKYTYSTSIQSTTLESKDDWVELYQILKNIEALSTNPVSVKASEYTETVQGKMQLHIFGSIAYFNRVDGFTDSGYAKLEQIDNRLDLNYNADVTALYCQHNTVSTLNSANIDYSIFKHEIASLLNKDSIIITDTAPILWNNFSTLKYDNKLSKSYIFRYEDYSFDADGNIIYSADSAKVSRYSKDTHCQPDGLYEVVVIYTYDGLNTNDSNTCFFQVFTFIIDNSSPTLIVEVKNDQGEYEELGLNTYTNKDVRLSWEVPTYFKNDVYIDINKTYFNGSNSAYNFRATYKANTTSLASGDSTYVNAISNMETYTRDARNYYAVTLSIKSGAPAGYSLNGNYEIVVHYNNGGKATFTNKFIIDKLDISGLSILPVVKNNDGNTYSIDKTIDFGTKQIVNSDFTFRYDAKASGAKIFVYYDKIDFVGREDFDQIIYADNGLGITTKFGVNGENSAISIGTQYSYDFNANTVSNSNLLTSNNSGLFLFRLEDEAGNTCRYVVFYDKTEPRFVISPEPDSTTHTVTETARVIWGNYKAIKISTDTGFSLTDEDLSERIDNYTKIDSESKLSLVLRYINYNKTPFNNLKVEKVGDDYYILVPITSATIEDRSYNNLFTAPTDANDFYFFTVNPISNVSTTYPYGQITLPKYNTNGKVQLDGERAIIKETYNVASQPTITTISYRGNNIERYIRVTYYLDNESNQTNTIYGVFGHKGDTNPRDTYIYSIYDGIRNYTSGALTVTRDRTDTVGFGLFDYTDNVNNAISLDETDSAYSASTLFISSKIDESLPEFKVTYRYYPYDTTLYTDYSITSIELKSTAGSQETYLELKMRHNTQTSINKTIKIGLTNAEGTLCPLYSYPYSLESTSEVDAYDDGYTNNSSRTRKYSLALNTTTDTNRQKVVTKEGLYIFERTYTDNDIDSYELGDDNIVAYYVYYIDRSGIINITTDDSIASNLYNIGSEIGFTLGSNYTSSYKKNINAQTIQNNQTAINNGLTSNANYKSADLFDTNKIQVEFKMAYDKHNFENFVTSHRGNYYNVIEQNALLSDESKVQLKSILDNQLFYTDHFSNKIYKTELSITVGGENTTGSVIMNEAENYYSTTGMSAYLKGTPMIGNRRSNTFNFYYDIGSNKYIIGINDQAGYLLYNSDGSIQDNYLSNKLEISFDISHDAPEGDLYGKYYGRHVYDNNSEITSNPSLPFDSEGRYAILSKYLQEGQLEPLSDTEKSISHSINGDYIQWKSTNNETMIFTFSITNDEYRAQIDPNNIKVYRRTDRGTDLIFNMVDGNTRDEGCIVSAKRQRLSYIVNEIEGTRYYAIIIFDNNLDEILDDSEKKGEYTQYRLLDPQDNLDKATYMIEINYVGNKNDYIGEEQGKQVSFYNTTYEIIVDRIKPTYNLTKLMAGDKYVYNTITTPVTTANYENLFAQYQSIYNFRLDAEHDFYRSDLENYFFALDCREKTSFVFEQIDELDNAGSIYIRKINDKNSYKFSVTPDDYKAYYNAVYLQGYPQFTPSNATPITDTFNSTIVADKYYKVLLGLDDPDGTSISAYYLKSRGIFQENCYYEIIEEDETGNYRVYAVYIPDTSNNRVVYSYQENSDASSEQTVTILYGSTPYVESKGMKLRFNNIQVKDNFLRANIVVSTEKINHTINVILDPNTLKVSIINRTTNQEMRVLDVLGKDKGDYANTDQFIEAINYVLDYYYELINDKTHSYYSQYGYNVSIDIVDRTGISVKDMKQLYNYEIDYVVTGSILTPKFTDHANNFTMTLEGQKGSTYLTEITVYKFNQQWFRINVDNSSNPKTFDLPEPELKKPIDYIFTRGVYKFVFKDNFNRVNEFFHEFGISSSQTGGSLDFNGNNSATLSDGYTYSADSIKYTYDSSAYNIYIKFVGKYIDEFDEYVTVGDSQNEIIYDSSNPNKSTTLERYGIEIITSGNTTIVTFHGVKDSSTLSGVTDLSKYHIKTILASNSDGYKWGDEATNKNIFVYDKKIAVYTAIQDINIKNLSGNTLNTSEHLNLTEDFELVTAWKSTVSFADRLDFNSRIILTRTFNNSTSRVESGYIVSQAGDYTAYVINDLGMTSRVISFSRGEGEISMYAVYGVDNNNNTERQLSQSSLITTMEYNEQNKVLFTYFITDDYFNYRDASTGQIITLENFGDYIGDVDLTSKFSTNVSASKYIDVRVNSNLSIKTKVLDIGFVQVYDKDGSSRDYPWVQYRVYSETKNPEETYTYRFVQIIFVDSTSTSFAEINVQDADSTINRAEYVSTINSTSSSAYINFSFVDAMSRQLLTPLGDTIYVDRYFDGKFAETTTLNMSDQTNIPYYYKKLSQVGLHEFVIRDLAGRTYNFNGSNKLSIYLINQIQFTVNGEAPINNQIFNGEVNFDINLQWFSDRDLSVKVTQNGVDTNIDVSKFTISEAGYYSIKMSAITTIDGNSKSIYTTYNFVIIDTEIANRSFSISKGAGFTIENLVKIIGYDEQIITDTYTTSTDMLLWFNYQEHGNCQFDVTLKKFDEASNSYRSFNFRIWINDQSPIILASIPEGTETKDTISINFNPGIIYSQIGKGYITLNDQVVNEFNKDTKSVVETITIDKKGTYWFKIFSADGTLVSSYKFTKNEPLNSMTKIILVCVAIAIVVVIILFFLIRRRGRYR